MKTQIAKWKSSSEPSLFWFSHIIVESLAIRNSSEYPFLGRNYHKLTSRAVQKLKHTLLKPFLSISLLLLKKCILFSLLSLKHHVLLRYHSLSSKRWKFSMWSYFCNKILWCPVAPTILTKSYDVHPTYPLSGDRVTVTPHTKSIFEPYSGLNR